MLPVVVSTWCTETPGLSICGAATILGRMGTGVDTIGFTLAIGRATPRPLLRDTHNFIDVLSIIASNEWVSNKHKDILKSVYPVVLCTGTRYRTLTGTGGSIDTSYRTSLYRIKYRSHKNVSKSISKALFSEWFVLIVCFYSRFKAWNASTLPHWFP